MSSNSTTEYVAHDVVGVVAFVTPHLTAITSIILIVTFLLLVASVIVLFAETCRPKVYPIDNSSLKVVMMELLAARIALFPTVYGFLSAIENDYPIITVFNENTNVVADLSTYGNEILKEIKENGDLSKDFKIPEHTDENYDIYYHNFVVFKPPTVPTIDEINNTNYEDTGSGIEATGSGSGSGTEEYITSLGITEEELQNYHDNREITNNVGDNKHINITSFLYNENDVAVLEVDKNTLPNPVNISSQSTGFSFVNVDQLWLMKNGVSTLTEEYTSSHNYGLNVYVRDGTYVDFKGANGFQPYSTNLQKIVDDSKVYHTTNEMWDMTGTYTMSDGSTTNVTLNINYLFKLFSITA